MTERTSFALYRDDHFVWLLCIVNTASCSVPQLSIIYNLSPQAHTHITSDILKVWEVGADALDPICHSARALVDRSCEQLHTGRLYPSAARLGSRSSGVSAAYRTTHSFVT